MSEIENLYLQFLTFFPVGLRPVVSIALVVLFVYSIFKVIKRDFIYIIILILLLPGSVPILKNIWSSLVELVKFMLKNK